jgi:tricorn protease
MKKSLIAISMLIGLMSLPLVAFGQTGTTLLMRNPTLSRTHIAFSYAGDLWTVSREGGEASRLTTGVGNEANPIFSPDGQSIAFTGEYDGNVDVYLVAATGGVPKRLTYHPGNDNLVGWTPDGKSILFVSGRNSYSGRFARLFTQAVDGTVPTRSGLAIRSTSFPIATAQSPSSPMTRRRRRSPS